MTDARLAAAIHEAFSGYPERQDAVPESGNGDLDPASLGPGRPSLFSVLLGWEEFMPIWGVPSLREIAYGSAR